MVSDTLLSGIGSQGKPIEGFGSQCISIVSEMLSVWRGINTEDIKALSKREWIPLSNKFILSAHYVL